MRHSPSFYIGRLLIYALLTGFALFMLFPFLYMVSTSFKNSTDVFRSPPRLLPYSPERIEIDGQMRRLYRFEIGGQVRELVITDERVEVGQFTTPELFNAARPRTSPIVAQAPMYEVRKTDDTVTPAGAEPQVVYEVQVDGQTQRLLLVNTPRLNKFVDPEDPSVYAYASERTAQAAEFVEFQVTNYNAVLGLPIDPRVAENDPLLQGSSARIRLDRALVNTTLVTVLVVIGQLVTSIFGGYAFSRIEFKGRDTLFLLYLGSIMIPFVVLIIPIYRLMVLLEWQNRIVSLIVPWIFTAYGTFLMRQFFISIPKEIEEAALLDGCSRFRILWTIFVPLSTPAIASLAIFSFLYAWNSFLWPLLIIGEGNRDNHVLTLGLIQLSNTFADRPNLVLTGAAIAILPPVIVFIFAQRYFIEGIATSGLKG
ncbi:MAG: carbohydrate ABC transporter permease [Anaerolineae bacterium]|nr:carbohydrate ABC transporter permease [Anaerolineae bacterium]MDW8171964.1 carbohydrate ABC transporter permease [Anaerolineae bacterium]